VVRDLLRIFPGVDVLVCADQLHSRDEAGDQLVCLSGELGEEFVEDSFSRQRELRDNILWKDRTEYGMCYSSQLGALIDEWDGAVGDHVQGREMPEIFRKRVVSAALKKSLLEICGSEENMRKLEGIHWAFVEGKHEYSCDLNLSQQIAFLKLVLSRISTEEVHDSQGIEVRGALRWDIPVLLERIEALEEE